MAKGHDSGLFWNSTRIGVPLGPNPTQHIFYQLEISQGGGTSGLFFFFRTSAIYVELDMAIERTDGTFPSPLELTL